MLVCNKGIFGSLKLPSSFILGSESGRGEGWRYSYNPYGNTSVEISIRCPAKFLSEAESLILKREIFPLAPEPFLFEEKNATEASDRYLTLVSPLLGNVGDNQVANTWNDMPQFQLEKLSWFRFQGHPAFRVWGGFLSAGEKVVKYFDGLFVVEDENADQLRAEEIYLQAASLDLFNQYLPAFAEVLDSIKLSG